MADKDLIRNIESAIRFGKPLLIENVGLELDPALDPVLNRQVFQQSGTWMIKLGDVVIPYDDAFQLYLTTRYSNPHYTPEVSVKVLLVNFTLVPSGLEDQLLGLVVMQERPDLEEQRSALIVSLAQMQQELRDLQDRILFKLSTLEGSPLDDLDFIVMLESSKLKSEDIKVSIEEKCGRIRRGKYYNAEFRCRRFEFIVVTSSCELLMDLLPNSKVCFSKNNSSRRLYNI